MAARSAYIGNPSTGDAVRGQPVFAKKSPGARYVPYDGLVKARADFPGSGDLFPTSLVATDLGAFTTGSISDTGTLYPRPAAGGGRFFAIAYSGGGTLQSATPTSALVNFGSLGSAAAGLSAYDPATATFMFTPGSTASPPRRLVGTTLTALGSPAAVANALCATDRGFEALLGNDGLAHAGATAGDWISVAASSVSWSGSAGDRPTVMHYADGVYIAGSKLGGLHRMFDASRAAPVWTSRRANTGAGNPVRFITKIDGLWFACIGNELYRSTAGDGAGFALVAAVAPATALLGLFKNPAGKWVWATSDGVGLSDTPETPPTAWTPHGLTGQTPLFCAFDGNKVYLLGSSRLRVFDCTDTFTPPTLAIGLWLCFMKT